MDTTTKFVTIAELKHNQPVEELTNIKGKFRMDHCQVTQHSVCGTNKRMVEHAVLIGATGHMNVTLWEDLAEKAMEISKTSTPFCYNRDFYLTTTATTVMESTKPFDVDESEKEVEVIIAERPNQKILFTVAHFESVSLQQILLLS